MEEIRDMIKELIDQQREMQKDIDKILGLVDELDNRTR